MQATWFENMKKVMNEIDWATEGRAIPLEGPLHFLDLGCVLSIVVHDGKC